MNLFFDTYALFEIVHKNKNYAPYLNIGIITTRMNLMELHYRLLFLYGKEIADKAFDRFLPFTAEISDEVIKEANQLKLLYKKREFSYIDCLGYMLSRSMNVKFLTGDKQFEKLEGVEFVK
ncbi:type II toxin-antitoxin system VapC family toxin [Candidatus Pacearchaeota archaeon]|nr:type II toxin-antitoxin system VapC family toxin [Candidatus Pacearchaeota archaeon]